MNTPKVIEVLRSIMCNTDRSSEERGAAATAIWLLCSEDESDVQETVTPTPVDEVDAAADAMGRFLASMKRVTSASHVGA